MAMGQTYSGDPRLADWRDPTINETKWPLKINARERNKESENVCVCMREREWESTLLKTLRDAHCTVGTFQAGRIRFMKWSTEGYSVLGMNMYTDTQETVGSFSLLVSERQIT